ncbi:MAG: VanZ family protein [Gammaproteobacteria bacterium]|nr:VanZ family protein [Gammaproteobacteria bacterium]
MRETALGYGVLAYMVIVILLLTLMPFQFGISSNPLLSWKGPIDDIIDNLFLFMPLGFIYRLVHRPSPGESSLPVLYYGLIFSIAIETSQLFLQPRTTTLTDVICNGIGAYVGARIYGMIRKNVDREGIAKLFWIEYPLMNLVYLLVPVLWLNAVQLKTAPSHIILLGISGSIGAILIGAVVGNHPDRSGTRRAAVLAGMAAMVWFLAASIPAFHYAPSGATLIAMLVILLAISKAVLSSSVRQVDQRFEVHTLKTLLPIIILYLLAVMVWPLQFSTGPWALDFHWNYYHGTAFKIEFSLLEIFVSFTIFGYYLSGMLGRSQRSFQSQLLIILLIGLAMDLLVCLVTGFQQQNSISVLELSLILLGSISGAILYKYQLEAIRQMVSCR